jgi:Fe-S cluster biogenesis protein NfuA
VKNEKQKKSQRDDRIIVENYSSKNHFKIKCIFAHKYSFMSKVKDLEEKVKLALSEILPYLQADNGGIELVDISKDTLKIRFTGTCKTCEMQYYTFKAAIEETIKNKVSEISKIEIVA